MTVFFVSDASGVFDSLDFESRNHAEIALLHNGFARLANGGTARDFLRSPVPPFIWRDHPNGRIYSAGRFWRNHDGQRGRD